MNLYDIHTHDTPITNGDDDLPSQNNYQYILNVYPLGFEDAKDSINCTWFSCGVHPWYSEDAEPQIKFLKEIAADVSIVAIGEAGYDKLRGASLENQRVIFEQQVALSEELQKPLIIHCVKAWEQLLASQKKIKPKQPWIIHGYRGKPELTEQLLKHNFYFSIGEKQNIESLQLIPLDRIFCETDVNDCTIDQIYQTLAETLEIDLDLLAQQIEYNVQNIFPMILLNPKFEE